MNLSRSMEAVSSAARANGVIVQIDPQAFNDILARNDQALVVHSPRGTFLPSHRYLTSYRGLAFYTKTREPLELSGNAEVVEADSIWIPQ